MCVFIRCNRRAIIARVYWFRYRGHQGIRYLCIYIPACRVVLPFHGSFDVGSGSLSCYFAYLLGWRIANTEIIIPHSWRLPLMTRQLDVDKEFILWLQRSS